MRTASGIPRPSPTFNPIELSDPGVDADVLLSAEAVVAASGKGVVDIDARLFAPLLLLLLSLVVVVDGVWVKRTREPLMGG
jgi:hypothetical protein